MARGLQKQESQKKHAAEKEKPPEPVSAATTTASLPTTGNGGVGAIRALASRSEELAVQLAASE